MIYITRDTTLPPFVPMPRFMLVGEYSINAKLLYALLLNRTMLSKKSGWESEDGRVYVIYTIKQIADDLNRSERTVKTALAELENAGLLTKVRQGYNRPNRLFLQIPDGVQLSSPPEGNIYPMDGQKTSPCMGQKLPSSNTDTEYIEHSDKEKGEDSRRVFGQYQNVFLSVSQFAQLQADFPTDYERTIEKLSQYIETHGKRYANHFALIQKWIAEDRAQPPNGKPAYDYEYQYEKGECL